MLHTTQKAIKAYPAIDLTHEKNETLYELRKNHYFTTTAYSAGIYGVNAILLHDENGNAYKITCRATSLWIMLWRFKK